MCIDIKLFSLIIIVGIFILSLYSPEINIVTKQKKL